MITATDSAISGGGSNDNIRVKIWDKDNGNMMVYDNQIGDSDDATPTMALGGGSIVVHKKK